MIREKLDLTQDDGYEALKGHVVRKALAARQRYSLPLDRAGLETMLSDPEIVRYTTQLRFDSSRLKPGEFAFAETVQGDSGRVGVIWVHEHFRERPEALPLLIAYHIPSINYSDLATFEEAELFGANWLGLTVDEYYEQVCRLADEVAPA